jgi:hypothetical protein
MAAERAARAATMTTRPAGACLELRSGLPAKPVKQEATPEQAVAALAVLAVVPAVAEPAQLQRRPAT